MFMRFYPPDPVVGAHVGALLSPPVQGVRVAAAHPLQVTHSVQLRVRVVLSVEIREILLIWFSLVFKVISVNTVGI